MATVIIQGGGTGQNNQATVDTDNNLHVTGGTGSNLASSANQTTEIGLLEQIVVNTGGGSPTAHNLVYNYNEVTNVAPGVETTITSYTAPSGKSSYLLFGSVSGTNMSEYRMYTTSTIFDKKYTSLTQFNSTFDYKSGDSMIPGYLVPATTTVYVKVIHDRSSNGNFNASLEVLEIG